VTVDRNSAKVEFFTFDRRRSKKHECMLQSHLFLFPFPLEITAGRSKPAAPEGLFAHFTITHLAHDTITHRCTRLIKGKKHD
jgi:hypothetical protein